MRITCTTLSDTANLLSVAGGIDVYCAAELKSTFVRSSGSNRLPFILDLAGIEYIDSTGVGALLFILSAARRMGRRVLFSGIAGALLRAVRLSGILPVIPRADTVQSAITDLAGSVPRAPGKLLS